MFSKYRGQYILGRSFVSVRATLEHCIQGRARAEVRARFSRISTLAHDANRLNPTGSGIYLVSAYVTTTSENLQESQSTSVLHKHTCASAFLDRRSYFTPARRYYVLGWSQFTNRPTPSGEATLGCSLAESRTCCLERSSVCPGLLCGGNTSGQSDNDIETPYYLRSRGY